MEKMELADHPRSVRSSRNLLPCLVHMVCLAGCLAFLGCTTGDHLPPHPAELGGLKEVFGSSLVTASAGQSPRRSGLPNAPAEAIQLTSAKSEPAPLPAALGVPQTSAQPAGEKGPEKKPPTGDGDLDPKGNKPAPEGLPAPVPIPTPGQPLAGGPPNPPGPAVSVDFASVFNLAAGNNVRIAFAREQINSAYAQLDIVRVAWLPSLRAGASYNIHNGALQQTNGDIINVNRESFRAGLGVSAVGTGTIGIPGIATNFALKDALFGPSIARSAAAAQQGTSGAAMNQVLLSVALAYLDLLQAEQQRAIAVETAVHAKALADLTSEFFRVGQGSEADADRARAELAIRQNAVVQAEDRVEVAGAALRELLHLEQNVRLLPGEASVIPLELTPPSATTNELVAAGLSNRPELVASRNLVAAARSRLLRDQFSPFLPTLILGISQGNFEGGHVGLHDTHGRFDLDAIAYWEVKNLGLGEFAAKELSRSQLRQSQLEELRVMDQVAREVYQYSVQVGNAKRQIATAEKAVQSATGSYKKNMERIRQGQGLPLEVLQSIQALDQAQREYLRSIVAFDDAQFRLLWALGWPPNGLKGACSR